MISGEDESSVINGRLRPRKSTASIPNPLNKSAYKTDNKVSQDKAKRNITPSKALPNKQDDLTAKADSLSLVQFLCPYCDRKFTTKLSSSKHARRIHLFTSKQDHFINCLFCNQTEAVPTDMIRHMVDSHPNQYFACLDCNTRFLSTSDLAEHKLNLCEKQKQAYRNKLRKKTSVSKKNKKKLNSDDKPPIENKELTQEPEFNGLVISCELKPSETHDAADIEDKITTNLILPSNIGNSVLEKNAVIILDDIQWNRRIPPNFSFRNADADQILSRLGVVHRSPRVGESNRREWLKMIDDSSQKFEKCFDTNFYSRVASNVQENLARFLDGSFNFSPDPDKVIKTRKSKSSAIINTAEGFPILLPHEQYSRNRFDGYLPRAIAPKHKWKWDSTENEKSIIIDANVIKRDTHVNNCIITLVSSLDIWTQLRMRRKFEEIFCKASTEKIEKQNIIGRQLKEILESREIPCSSSEVVKYTSTAPTIAPVATVKSSFDFPSFLGLSSRASGSEGTASPVPAILSGEWVRPRCYVCCACGDQTRESRALTAHMAANHPNAQVQHYEIVGEALLNADILKHLYVPPSQMSNRTRPLRGFRDCTKCKKSVTMEDLHQHMLDCAGDTPTVRRKGRSRPFGVRRRRPRLPDNTIRKKIRKDLRVRHNKKGLMRARPRIRTEVGDAESIRRMIKDLPAKRHRQAADQEKQVLRPRRKLEKQRNKLKIKRLNSKETKPKKLQSPIDDNDSSIIDEDDQPLKPKTKTEPEKTIPAKKRFSSRVVASKNKKRPAAAKELPSSHEHQENTPTETASSSQLQQMSRENTTQRLNINARGNNEDRENRNSKNGNGDDREKPSGEDREKDNHKGVAPDPTLLKHSINNITALTLNKAQQYLLPHANSEETVRDTLNVLLENEVSSSIPDKPPIPTNQKSSSEKKRQSLLNCIEKIKSQQKGETMFDRATLMKKDRRSYDVADLPLMDPHPAVISRTRDESGAAKNVVPDNIDHQKERDSRYRRGSDIESQRKTNETYTWAPQVEQFYSQVNYNPEFTTPRKMPPSSGGQRRKLYAARAAYNEFEASQLHFNQIMQQHQWNVMHNLDPTAYIRMAQPLLQQSILQQPILQPQRMPLSENVLLQIQANEAIKNGYPVHYNNLNFTLPGQYDTSDINYEGRREQASHRNETTQYSNISAISPRLWGRESAQNQQMTNDAGMLQPISSNDLNTRGIIAQKRVSESSETDVYCNSRNIGDINMLNYANLQCSSAETTANMYLPPTVQGNREASQYYNTKRTKIQKVGYKPPEFSNIPQSGYGRNYDNVLSDLVQKGTEHYRTAQSQAAAVNNLINESPIILDERLSITRSGITVDDFHFEGHKDLIPKSLYSSNSNKKKNHDRYVAEHPHLSPSVPTETQAAKINISPSDLTIMNFPYEHMQSNMPVSGDIINDRKKQPSYKEVTSEDICSSSNDQPLDLSAKNILAGRNDDRAFGVSHLHSVSGARPEDYNNALDKSVQEFGSEIEHDNQQISEDVPTNLSLKDNSQSINMNDQQNFVNNPVQPAYYKEIMNTNTTVSHYRTENSYQKKTAEKDIAHTKYNDYSRVFGSVALDPESVRLNEINKKPAWENPHLLETTKGTTDDKMPTTNLNYHAFNDTEDMQNANINSNHNFQHLENYPEISVQEDLHATNKTLENEEIREQKNYDVITVDEKGNTKATSSQQVDQDPETAKKIALFPKELVDLLGAVPREAHHRFVDVISQLIPPANKDAAKPVITVQPPQNITKKVDETLNKVNTPSINNASTNYNDNRLTVNTTSLPSSSILPKKRHSPNSKSDSNTNFIKSSPKENVFIPSAEVKKTISDDNEHEEIDKIIDLTDDDLNNTITKPNTPDKNALLFQDHSGKLQNPPKSSNEKTASLRAVRKTPLPRKSISDEKEFMVTKEVYSQQSIRFDSKLKDTEQIYNSECIKKIVMVDNTVAKNAANIAATNEESRATFENIALIQKKTSNFSPAADFKRKELLDSPVYIEQNEPEMHSVVKKNFDNTQEVTPARPIDTKKSVQHSFLGTYKSISSNADKSQGEFSKSDPREALNHADNIANINLPGKENELTFLKNNNLCENTQQISITYSDEQSFLETPIQIPHKKNTESNFNTNFAEEDDSDDDVSLAVILKQKKLEQKCSSLIDVNTCVTNNDNMQNFMKKDENMISNSNEISNIETSLDPEDQPLELGRKINIIQTIETTANNTQDIKSGAREPIRTQDYEETDILLNNTSVDCSEIEENNMILTENFLTKENEQTHENAYDEEITKTLLQKNITEDSARDSESIQVNESLENDDKVQIMQVNKDECTNGQNTSNENNELRNSCNASQEVISNQLEADQVADTITDDKINNTNGIKLTPIDLPSIQIGQIETENKSAIKENSEIDESTLTTQPDSSSDFKDDIITALRRSTRGKSTFSDGKDLIDYDTNSVEINHPRIQNIPVTKKQLIFSKLLQGDTPQNENNIDFIPNAVNNVNDVKSASEKLTKTSDKYKRSLSKAKNKKKKIPKLDDGFSDSVNIKLVSKNNINNDNEDLNTSNNYIDNDEMKNNINYDNEDLNTSNNHVNPEGETILKSKDRNNGNKRKLKTSLFDEKDDISRVKRSRITNKDEQPLNSQEEMISNDSTNNKEREIHGNTEPINSTHVKSITSEKNISSKDEMVNTSNFSDIKKHIMKNTPVEIRTACYNRPIVSKQTCSTSIHVKNPENYDPYDIDFDIDMAEASRPIVKRRGNKLVTGNNTTKLVKKFMNSGNPVDKMCPETDIAQPVPAVTNAANNCDSDSSISDAPLQKYVEEKEKIKIEGLKLISDCNEKTGGYFDLPELSSTKGQENLNQNNEKSFECNTEIQNNSERLIDDTYTIDKKTTDDISQTNYENIEKLTTKQQEGADQIKNVIESSAKSNVKQKKKRRSKTSKKKDSLNVPSETDQQLSSDKYMENFGFYSVRKPRKSNLLASKKISETFIIMKTNDEAYFRFKDRQKKSSHSETKKTSDGAHTSKAQDTNSTNNDKKCSMASQNAGENNNNNAPKPAVEGEVDLITAQKILDSDEIRNLERDLYFGFKEAAEANAGKTSGLNHLRAEQARAQGNHSRDINNQDVPASVEPVPSTSHKRVESPERSESPETPDSPEGLKDKPLMYPEEEVNIYEDKYDIIKRRREASANAKQIQKVENSRKSKNGKSKKKTDRKIKKITKKLAYQGSQVPTKGALKGFDGIKVSIPTQNYMPPNVSSTNHQQRQSRSQKRKESGKFRTTSGSSCISESGVNARVVVTPDIYEFQDDERPVTKGFRLKRFIDECRSSSSETEDRKIILFQKHRDITSAFVDHSKNEDIEKPKIKKGKGKGKGKRTHVKETNTNKETEVHEESKQNGIEMQTGPENSDVINLNCKSDAEKKADDREYFVKNNNELTSDDHKKLETPQKNVEPFEDSDSEMQATMPCTSGFVPDRNDESSYESDSSSQTPLLSVLKGPYACTCLSEIDSDDSETERGCAHSSCRYSHLNAAKNAVMGKIFKNNAVRCEKPDDSSEESKPDLDRLFDSLLEKDDINKATEKRVSISPIPGPSSATTNYFRIHSNNQPSVVTNEKPNVNNNISSLEQFVSEKFASKTSQTSPINTDSLTAEDTSSYNFGEITTELNDSGRYIMLSQKHIQTEDSAQATSTIDDSVQELEQESEQLNIISQYNDSILDDIFDNLDNVPESSDYIVLKNENGEIKKTRGTQTKLRILNTIPQTRMESSSLPAETSEKIAKKNRRLHKKHKSHHKRVKVSEDGESDRNEQHGDKNPNKLTHKRVKVSEDGESDRNEQHGDKNPNKLTGRFQKATGENEIELMNRKRSNETRKSDEGISTSHASSADAYDLAASEDTGLAVHRARRKCTVGKQNVLAEHWSSSESEAGGSSNRNLKGKKSSISKKTSRAGKKDRAIMRPRVEESDDDDSETRAPPPKVRARTASLVSPRDLDRDSDTERDVKQEQHGWIVGHSHKKLMTMLACCKSKPRIDEKEKERQKEISNLAEVDTEEDMEDIDEDIENEDVKQNQKPNENNEDTYDEI